MQVYLDAVFILNFLVDLLLVLGTNRLTGFPPELKRAVCAAALGGIYGGLCILPELFFLSGFLWRTVFFGLISVAAFGYGRDGWRRGAIFLLLSMALGGIATGAGVRDFAAVSLCAALVAILCAIGSTGGSAGRICVPVELNWQGRKVKLLALRDTGNTLRDPVTGEQVLVCGADVGEELLGLPESSFLNPAAMLTSGTVPGLRLIPYHTIGEPSGLMIALRLKNVRIGKSLRDPLVAFAPHRIGNGENYRMLTGGMFS